MTRLERPPSSAPPRVARREVQAALEAMRSDPSHAWTIAALTELACLSPSALHRAFALEMGMTPMAWLGHIRVAVMARLLLETDESVQAIARRVGWRNRGHATRQFKERTGSTPAQYRRAASSYAEEQCVWCGSDLPRGGGTRGPPRPASGHRGAPCLLTQLPSAGTVFDDPGDGVA